MLGLARLGLGDLALGRQQIAAVEKMLTEKRAARYAAADEAEAKARKEKKSEHDTAKAMADAALVLHGSAIQNMECALAELRGYAALAANDPAAARAEFEKIKSSDLIRKDHLARAFSLAGDPVQAEAFARQAVEKGPGEVYPLAVLIEVLHRAAKSQDACAEFQKLRVLAADADLDMPVFQRLRPLADAMSLPADWRILRQQPADVGQRPDLASLGPFRWQPTPATSWSLPGADGRPVSLEQYNGKPVVVLLYLGSGCLHCVEQLHKFTSMNADFSSAGIAIVAISSESLDSLKSSMAKLAPSEAIPFPLAADAVLSVFKAYRAYDDFENLALHGTFLIDGEGLVRWHDISSEPFSNTKFLLDEAKRLLGQRKAQNAEPGPSRPKTL